MCRRDSPWSCGPAADGVTALRLFAPESVRRIRVIGAHPAGLRDMYYYLLAGRWWQVIALLVGAYLAVNALFALLFLASGGIDGARPGSFADAFFFSVQTLGTI